MAQRMKFQLHQLTPLELGLCDTQGCDRQGEEVLHGKVACSRHLRLLLVTPTPVRPSRPGTHIGRR